MLGRIRYFDFTIDSPNRSYFTEARVIYVIYLSFSSDYRRYFIRY